MEAEVGVAGCAAAGVAWLEEELLPAGCIAQAASGSRKQDASSALTPPLRSVTGNRSQPVAGKLGA
ncbi:hypothetical protein [Massilia sp. Leaf139]|uniref:hypothetical protein n=1 Tax=Massilia sp. Leaf139 TaxID=1736272 RepID=UPI0006F40116|nr:hypothetical protein [Massilia sp. Leaf139]KQQ88024.1 hypothetical protein ASF77_15010 [Massilia sp. Leaf139]